jgi:hypothetical protein
MGLVLGCFVGLGFGRGKEEDRQDKRRGDGQDGVG